MSQEFSRASWGIGSLFVKGKKKFEKASLGEEVTVCE